MIKINKYVNKDWNYMKAYSFSSDSYFFLENDKNGFEIKVLAGVFDVGELFYWKVLRHWLLVYDVRKEPNYTKLEAKEDWLPSLEGDTDCSLDHI